MHRYRGLDDWCRERTCRTSQSLLDRRGREVLRDLVVSTERRQDRRHRSRGGECTWGNCRTTGRRGRSCRRGRHRRVRRLLVADGGSRSRPRSGRPVEPPGSSAGDPPFGDRLTRARRPRPREENLVARPTARPRGRRCGHVRSAWRTAVMRESVRHLRTDPTSRACSRAARLGPRHPLGAALRALPRETPSRPYSS